MRKLWLSLCSLFVLVGCSHFHSPFSSLPEGVTLIERSPDQSDPGKATIPYSKYRLENGLTVILSPDHSDPLVHVDVRYHVGSAREEIGKSGFAHFFEHMMFQGSKHVPDPSKLITESGGYYNGTTGYDRTNYFETVPANQLEKMLWLESDRMGFLLDSVSQRKFEIQRDTVKNERAQSVDNRPYGILMEKMAEAMYPEGHPYSWQPIGYVSDLDKVDVNDLKAFFLRWYGPNNAILTIGGDIDTTQTLQWVQKYFGSIPAGPKVENAPKQPAVLPNDRYVTVEDNVQQPLVMIGWPTTYLGEEHQPSLTALARVLGGSGQSLLYTKLVKTQQAIDVGAFSDCNELACNFYIYAIASSGEKGKLKSLYEQMMQIVQDIEKEGVNTDRLEEMVGMAEANAVFGGQSVESKVEMLAHNQMFFNQPDRTQLTLQAIHAITPDSVIQSYHEFIAHKPKVVLSIVPRGHTEFAARKANFTAPSRHIPDYEPIREDQLHYREVKDNFDRNVMPVTDKPVEMTVPELYRFKLKNGINVLGTQSTETPTVTLQILLPASERQAEVGKEGIAKLTAALVQEETATHNLDKLQSKLEKLGSSVNINVSGEHTAISISALRTHLDETLAIAEEILTQPALDEDDFQRLKRQQLEDLVSEQQDPQWLATRALRRVLFSGSYLDRASTTESVQALTLEDVKRFYQRNYTPVDAQIVVVGDIDQTELQQALHSLEEWQGQKPDCFARYTAPKAAGSTHIYLVDKPDASQAIVQFGRQALPFDATGEMFKTQLANFNLGGSFNGRINMNLREDKGYTYGSQAYFIANKDLGAIIFDAKIRADVTAAAIKEIYNDMQRYADQGMTNDELQFMRLAQGQKEALSYETPSQKLGLLSMILRHDLPADFLQTQSQIVATVKKSTLNQLAKKWFNPQDYQIIVVGDAKLLRPQLEQLGFPLENLEIVSK